MSAPIPTLRTPRLVLRPFDASDAPTVQLLAGDERVASTTLNVPHPYEDGMAEAWIATHASGWASGKLLVLAITEESEGLTGAVSLHVSARHRRGELGYWVGVPYWNRGYATEASAALRDYGFEELGLERILGRHLTRNRASGRVMEKLGMTHEGVMRRHIVKWDVPEDVAIYGILREEHETREADGG